MIVDVLANSERIEGLNPYFKVVFDYIKKHDFKVFGWYRIVLGIVVLVYFYLIAA